MHEKTRLHIETDGPDLVITIRRSRASLNETFDAVIDREIGRAVAHLLRSRGDAWLDTKLRTVLDAVAQREEGTLRALAERYFREVAPKRVEAHLDRTIQRATAALQRRILGRAEPLAEGEPLTEGEAPEKSRPA